ncbi:MAG TPA: hypothetical protein VEL51_19030 [Vicinamibacterales bacterium]|nr:hypothetical protein [Vicinamibacterales bacterium]
MTKPLGIVLSILLLAAAPADLSGVWRLDFDPDFGGTRHANAAECHFKQEGSKLSGDCAGRSITGEVRNRKVTLNARTGRNNEFPVTFVGKLDKEQKTISGEWHLADNLGKRTGKFTVRKQ